MFQQSDKIAKCVEKILLGTLIMIGMGAAGVSLHKASEILFVYASDKNHMYGLRFFVLLVESLKEWSLYSMRQAKIPSPKPSVFTLKYKALVQSVPDHNGTCYLYADITKLSEADRQFFNQNHDPNLQPFAFQTPSRLGQANQTGGVYSSDVVSTPFTFSNSKPTTNENKPGFARPESQSPPANRQTDSAKNLFQASYSRVNTIEDKDRNSMFSPQNTSHKKGGVDDDRGISLRSTTNPAKGNSNDALFNNGLNSIYSFNDTKSQNTKTDLGLKKSTEKVQLMQALINGSGSRRESQVSKNTNAEYGLVGHQTDQRTTGAFDLVLQKGREIRQSVEQEYSVRESNRSSLAQSIGRTPKSNAKIVFTPAKRESSSSINRSAKDIHNKLSQNQINHLSDLTAQERHLIGLVEEVVTARKLMMHEIFKHKVVLESIHLRKQELQNILVSYYEDIEKFLYSKNSKLEKEQKRALCELEYVNSLFGIYDESCHKFRGDNASFGRFRIRVVELISKIYGHYPPFYDKFLKTPAQIFVNRNQLNAYNARMGSRSRSRESNHPNSKNQMTKGENFTPFSKRDLLSGTLDHQNQVSLPNNTSINQNTVQGFQQPVHEPERSDPSPNRSFSSKYTPTAIGNVDQKGGVIRSRRTISESQNPRMDLYQGENQLADENNCTTQNQPNGSVFDAVLNKPKDQQNPNNEYFGAKPGVAKSPSEIKKGIRDAVLQVKGSMNTSRQNETGNNIKISFDASSIKEKRFEITERDYANSLLESSRKIHSVRFQDQENSLNRDQFQYGHQLDVSENIDQSDSLYHKSKFNNALQRIHNDALNRPANKGQGSLRTINRHNSNQKENNDPPMRGLLSPNINQIKAQNKSILSSRYVHFANDNQSLSAELLERKNEELRRKKMELQRELTHLKNEESNVSSINMATNRTQDLINMTQLSRFEKFRLKEVSAQYLMEEYQKKEDRYAQLKSKYDSIRQKFVKKCFNEYFSVDRELDAVVNDVTIISQPSDMKKLSESGYLGRSRSVLTAKQEPIALKNLILN